MKTALIVGGSRGIGRECVKRFSKDGYAVAFTYLNSEAEAVSLAGETGAFPILADSADEEAVRRAVALACEKLSGIDCLVYNSAISSTALVTDISYNEWNRMLAVNLGGAFLYAREVIPDMLKRKTGRIITVSSVWGLKGASCESHYAASKWGLIGFTKSLAEELGPSGITVNSVAPGVINTDMNAHLSKEDLNALCEETPLMRIGDVSDIASVIAFLASEGAGFITGEVINASGGFVI